MVTSVATSGSIQGRRIFYLIFATATLLVLGLIYAWSIFARPIGTTYSEYGPMLSQVFQVSMFVFCVSAILGSQIFKKISPRAAVIVAAVLLGVGFVLTAFCASWGIWTLFVFYGLIAASGCGIGYNAIIALVGPWFPDKTGLCSGVMMMGFGISSLVFGSLANAAFAIIDWSVVFIIIAIVGVVIMLALACVVRPAPVDIARQLGMQGMAVATKESPVKNQGILGTKVFWLYSVWATLVIACGLALIGSAAQGAGALGFDASFSALLVGLVSTMNGVGRVLNGALFDRFGLVFVMRLSALLAILTMAGLSIAFLMEGAGISPVLYVVAGILVACPYGSVPVMAAAYSRQRYKISDFSKNLGIANCNIASAATLNIIISAILGAPHAGNGVAIYAVLGVCAVIALLSLFFFEKVYRSDLARISEELQ